MAYIYVANIHNKILSNKKGCRIYRQPYECLMIVGKLFSLSVATKNVDDLVLVKFFHVVACRT